MPGRDGAGGPVGRKHSRAACPAWGGAITGIALEVEQQHDEKHALFRQEGLQRAERRQGQHRIANVGPCRTRAHGCSPVTRAAGGASIATRSGWRYQWGWVWKKRRAMSLSSGVGGWK